MSALVGKTSMKNCSGERHVPNPERALQFWVGKEQDEQGVPRLSQGPGDMESHMMTVSKTSDRRHKTS